MGHKHNMQKLSEHVFVKGKNRNINVLSLTAYSPHLIISLSDKIKLSVILFILIVNFH